MSDSICEDCARLDHEMESAVKLWTQQRALHKLAGLYGRSARRELDYLRRVYQQARAKVRLHNSSDHPEKDIKATKEDYEIMIREFGGVTRRG